MTIPLTDQPAPSRLSPWLLAAGLLLVPLLLYSNAISHPFLIDDHDAIATHPDVLRVQGLMELWGHDYWAGRTEDANLYRPISVLSYWLNQRLTPDSPAGFRVVNILLLGGIGVTLFFYLRRLVGPPLASLAATLFVCHPVHGEAINHIVGRADLLAVLGIVGFLAIQRIAMDRGWTRGRLIFAGLLALLAMGSKESGFVLLPMAAVQTWVCSSQPRKHESLEKADRGANRATLGNPAIKLGLLVVIVPALILIAARVAVVGLWANYSPGSDDLTGNPLRGVGLFDRLPDALAIFGWYIKQLIAPALTFNHHPGPDGVGTWSALAIIGGVLFFFSLASLVYLIVKRHLLSLPLTLFICHYFVVGNLLLPTGVYAANRLTVATTAAGALALGIGLGPFLVKRYRTRLVGGISLAVLALLLASWTYTENPDWSSELVRMQADAEAQPDNPVALYWLGQAYLAEDQAGQAIAVLEKTHALTGGFVGRGSGQAALALADAYLYHGKDAPAWSLYSQVIRFLGPPPPRQRINAAMAAFNIGLYDEAKELAESVPNDGGREVLNALQKMREPEDDQE